MKITIAVPVYNVEEYIVRCARSLFCQTYGNIEYLFIDDCSTDRSVERLCSCIEDYPERKDQIQIVHHSVNRGLSAARNTAVSMCHGDFILHVDSDDYISKDAVAILVREQRKTNADIISGGGALILDNGMYSLDRKQYQDNYSMAYDMLKLSVCHTIWGRLIRTSIYRDYNISAKEGVNIGEDMQVMPILAFYAKRVSYVDENLYYYDCRNSSSYMSTSKKNGFLQYQNRLMQELASILELQKFFNEKSERFKSRIDENLGRINIRLLLLYCKMQQKDEFQKLSAGINKIGWSLIKSEGREIVLYKIVRFYYPLCRIISQMLSTIR